ncbi:thiamine diphosphokinase [Neobacillus niacini]|uniref:thiamine diphosphokinase n=1 Tax=Neobacillus niacini TaxID=86668 RepID=UPI0021CB52B7|nr:thiamine diphosphokinase [Neobacillus niacini]MCM3767967.1 thiamine diphosphokinase [Neobacillus niacini]
MVINILAGGPEELLPDLTEYNTENEVWVGVDRGVFHLLSRNIQPMMAFGDFDSVSERELAFIESKITNLKRFKPEKDETDTELALNWAVAQKPEEIRLFGATGGRLDHLLANVQLLTKPLSQGISTKISLIDRKNIAYLAGPGTYTVEKMLEKKYISFVPLTLNVSDLTLRGFKFPLENRHISIGSTLCISNELISEYGTFSFSEGILIVIRSHD